jgi:hypothetical protein
MNHQEIGEQLRLLITGLVLFFTISVQARGPEAASRDPGYREFFRYCRAHRTVQADIPPPAVGRVSYLPTAALEANQGRFSWASLQRKLRKGLEKEPDAYIDEIFTRSVRRFALCTIAAASISWTVTTGP